MTQDIRAWESEDASFIVLGTHDVGQVVPALLEYCQQSGFDANSYEFADTWERVHEDKPTRRWIKKTAVDASPWTGVDSKPLSWSKTHEMADYLPYMAWY